MAEDRAGQVCPCGAPVTVAPCEGCGEPLKIQGRVFGVCARPGCAHQIHVSRHEVRFVAPPPPKVTDEALRLQALADEYVAFNPYADAVTLHNFAGWLAGRAASSGDA